MKLRFSMRHMLFVVAILGAVATGIGMFLRSRVVLHIVAPRGSEVYIDNHFLGRAPVAVTSYRFTAWGYQWQPDVDEGRAAPTPECGVVLLHVRRSDGTSPLIWFKSPSDDGQIRCKTPWGMANAILTSEVTNNQLAVTFQNPRSNQRWSYAGGVHSVGGASLVVTRLAKQLEVRLTLPLSKERCAELRHHKATVVLLSFRSINSDKWVNVYVPLQGMTIESSTDGKVTLISNIEVPPRRGVYCARASLMDCTGHSISGVPDVIASGCVELQK